MSEENQIQVPESFLNLFQAPGGRRLIRGRLGIIARYELCEDLAQALIEPSRSVFWSMNLAEDVVLERTLQGLLQAESGEPLSTLEAWWVVRRLCELLDWPETACPPAPDRTA
ncbi:MAG: hypothetical protein RL322_1792 [Pseudomonadota bacterium]|jgi:hypothetical protein